MKFVSVALVLAASACAQVTAPLLGWLPEGAQIRRMNGLPAAAALGSVVNAGHKLANIAVSSSQNYVLASDAHSGEVLLILPGVSAITLDLPVRPDRIVTSPRGSSASVWLSAAARIEIITGLPAAPAIRQIDAAFLNATPLAIAVSDDGQWIAAASSAGVYAWGSDSVPHQVYPGGDAAALAFFAGRSDLAIATSTQLLSVSAGESVTGVLYQNSFSPVGLATSFDNRKIVLADRSGKIYSVDMAALTPSVMDCECRPNGVFGLGGAVFRLTSSTLGPVQLFDAASGAILAIPRATREAFDRRPSVRSFQATPTLPVLTISLSPTPTGYLQQPAMTITAASAYSSEIDGNVTLTFTPSAGGADASIQFSNASATVNFTIPAGATQANFSGAPSVSFSTGTVAGTIVLTANITAPTPVASVATQTVTTLPAAPVISSVQLSQTTGGVTVVITGYSSTHDLFSGSFTFTLSNNASLTANDIGVPLSPEFQTYYADTSSYATGSEFTVTVPFTVTGNAADMVGVSVILINSKAASSPVSSR